MRYSYARPGTIGIGVDSESRNDARRMPLLRLIAVPSGFTTTVRTMRGPISVWASSPGKGGTPASASIGTDSVIVAGKSPDGAKEVTVLLFTQGPAFTTLEFDSAAGDPVPQEFVLDVAGKQAKKIADGLGG